MLSKELKLSICARCFYQDNMDDYDDYRHAKVEMMAQSPSDTFVDFMCEPLLKPEEEGYKVFVDTEGHVYHVRLSDGFLKPKTELTEDDGLAMVEKFQQLAAQYADLTEIEILQQKMGWTEVVVN